MLGYIFSLFTVPFRTAGEFIGQEMGLTLASISDPTQGAQTSVLGQVFETIGVLLFFGLNIHHVFLAALHETFLRRPEGGNFLPNSGEPLLRAMAGSREWGLLLAAPIGCSLFITSVVLALMSRAAPQMNIMSVGFTLRIAVGLLGALWLLPELGNTMLAVLANFCEIVKQAF